MTEGSKANNYICVRCQKPVEVHRKDYETFEKMHWICFHLEYEHDADPDAPCADPSCPNWHLQVFRQKLADLGCDPDRVLEEAIEKRFKQDS